MQRLITCLVLILFCHPLLTLAASEEGKPLWELGAAGGAGITPDYPAADEYHPVGLVLPYVLYRGRILRAGDKSAIARGRFLHSERLEFDLSLSGSFPADSNHNDARRGMPDLDTLIEVGPRLQLILAAPLPQVKIGFELPIRTVFSVAFNGIGYRGVTFHPRLTYYHDDLFGVITRLKLIAGPIFATEELMDYFYQVRDRYVTAERPAYNAAAGYLGSEIGLLARRQLSRHLSLYGALKVSYYKGATNADSPLFRTNKTAAVGLGFVWSFYQSHRRGVD